MKSSETRDNYRGLNCLWFWDVEFRACGFGLCVYKVQAFRFLRCRAPSPPLSLSLSLGFVLLLSLSLQLALSLSLCRLSSCCFSPSLSPMTSVFFFISLSSQSRGARMAVTWPWARKCSSAAWTKDRPWPCPSKWRPTPNFRISLSWSNAAPQVGSWPRCRRRATQ